MKASSTVSLISTMTLLTRADSLTPATSSRVTAKIPDGTDQIDARLDAQHTTVQLQRGCGQFLRQHHAKIPEQGGDVPRPARGHGRSCHAIFEQQQPAHRPGHHLAERDVGVRIGGTGHGNRRSELRVTQPCKRAGKPCDHERQHDGRAGEVGRCIAGQHEDASADDGTDAETHEVQRSQGSLELSGPEFGLDLGNGLLGK